MNSDRDLCRKCFTSSDEVVEETLIDRESALVRFVTLAGLQHCPVMCETPAGECRVCHVPREKAGFNSSQNMTN